MYRLPYIVFFLCSMFFSATAQDSPCLQDEGRLWNLATEALVSQSSTSANGTSNIAIDGTKTGAWSTGQATRTLDEPTAWWEADLGDTYSLESIQIWFPSDVYPEGFSDYYVLYSPYPIGSSDLATALATPSVQYLHVASNFDSGSSFPLGGAAARYVRIQNSGGGVLSLIEIDIPGTYGEICGNGCDDDKDGFFDCADSDCQPNLYNVTKVDPTCPICPDGAISIQAFGEDLRFSIDGGQNFEEACDGIFLCEVERLLEGDYEVLVTNASGCSVVWEENPVQLRATGGDPQGSCLNGGFEEGTFDGWTGKIGAWIDNKITMTTNGIDSNSHTMINAVINFTDPIIPNLDLTPPSGGSYIVKLGNKYSGANAEQLTYCFEVSAENADFNFFYLPVLEDRGHNKSIQPFFEYRVLDAEQEVLFEHKIAADVKDPFFLNYKPPNNADPIAYQTWTCENINLSAYIGQQLCIVFTTADCREGGHFGYTYIDGLCDASIAPIPDIEVGEYLCSGSNASFLMDGSASVGENQYAWRVCKLDANENQVDCKTAFLYGEAGQIDIRQFYLSNGGVWECGATYHVSLTLKNGCDITNGTFRNVKTSCETIVDYPDFVYCDNSGSVPIQGTNNCSDCDILWATDLGILDDYTVAFPTILSFPPGRDFMDLSVRVIDRETRCEFEEEVRVYRFLEPKIHSLNVEQIDLCIAKVRAVFFTPIPLDFLGYSFINQTTDLAYPGILETNPNNLNMHTVTYHIPLEDSTMYTFSLGISNPLFEGMEKYSCTDSEEITFGEYDYHGDISNLHLPSVFDPTKVNLLEKEWVAVAPVVQSYNAYFYELNIFHKWGAHLYSKTDSRAYGEAPFTFIEIRYDGKIRSCPGRDCHEEDVANPVDENGDCVGNTAPIPCSDIYWDDPYAVCFNDCGKPKYWPSGTVFTYWLKLKNCTEEKLLKGDFTILY